MILPESLEQGLITADVLQVLTNDSPRVPIFYLIPKIHKRLDNPLGRPIVSGMDSIFQPLAIYTDGFFTENC